MEKVCAIVGVGPGLGLAVAERFGREGFKVGMLARRMDALEGYEQTLRDKGVDATGLPVEAGQPDDVGRALGDLRGRVGKIDVLVYNAAAMRKKPPSALTPEELVEDFRVSVAGALAAAHAVVPSMRAKGGGTILTTGGGLALEPSPGFASLAVGKAGLRSLSLSLAAELAPENVHVATVTICGFIQPGTHFAPEVIAEKYWELHVEPRDRWTHELVYR